MGVVQDYLNKTGKTSTSSGLIDSYNAYKSKQPAPVVKKTTAPSVKGGLSALFNPVTNPVSTPIAKSAPLQPLQKKLAEKPPVKSPYKTDKPATISKTGDAVLKFGAKTAVTGASMVAQGLDFTTDFVAKNLVSKKTPQWKPIEVLNDKWLKWYGDKETQGEIPTQKLQKFVDTIAQSDYIQDSPEWKKLPLKEKFSKDHIGETILNLAPSVIASIATYAINPFFGFAVSATSTAQDVKDSAISSGVPSDKAEKLGLATGLAVGWLDKLVPNEVFSNPATKKLFLSALLKNIVKTTIKETGTEVAQEDIQLAVEATFRKDLGWNEVKTRNAMSALGGFLGGTGYSTIGSFANQTIQEDILDQPVLKAGENDPQEVLNKVVGTPAQDTPKGKELIKQAMEAQMMGTQVTVEPRIPKQLSVDDLVKTLETKGDEIYRDTVEEYKKKIQAGIKIDPVVVTPKGEVLDGGHKLTAMKELGVKKADIVVEQPKGLTPEVTGKVKTEKVTPPKTDTEVKTPKPVKQKIEVPDKFTSRVFERLQQEKPEVLSGDLQVERKKLKEDMDRVIDLIKKDKQKAYDIAMNKDESEDISSTTANIALAEMALEEGNNDLYRKLVISRSLDLTRKGFDIAAEKGSITDNSTSKYVKELISTRLEGLGKRYLSGITDRKTSNKEHATKVLDKKVAKLETEIRNKKLNVKTALQLLESLTCLT